MRFFREEERGQGIIELGENKYLDPESNKTYDQFGHPTKNNTNQRKENYYDPRDDKTPLPEKILGFSIIIPLITYEASKRLITKPLKYIAQGAVSAARGLGGLEKSDLDEVD